jgi:hypothetical protein
MFMVFLMRWKLKPEMRDAAFKRFKDKGHNAPPDLKIIGSWFALHQLESWAVVEADDPLTVGKGMYDWSDVGEHEITPVTDYEGVRSILG